MNGLVNNVFLLKKLLKKIVIRQLSTASLYNEKGATPAVLSDEKFLIK